MESKPSRASCEILNRSMNGSIAQHNKSYLSFKFNCIQLSYMHIMQVKPFSGGDIIIQSHYVLHVQIIMTTMF